MASFDRPLRGVIRTGPEVTALRLRIAANSQAYGDGQMTAQGIVIHQGSVARLPPDLSSSGAPTGFHVACDAGRNLPSV